MRNYKVIFYFLNKNNEQEYYEDGMPKYNIETIQAYNGGEAIDKLRSICEQEPVIVEVKEEQRDERII